GDCARSARSGGRAARRRSRAMRSWTSWLARSPFPLVLALATGCGGPAAERPAGSAERSFDPDSVPEAYARSTAAVMWPGTTRAWQITPEGDLYDGETTVRVRAASGATVASPPRVIAFEQRWMPVAHWWRASGDVTWRFEGVAFPEPAPRDSQLVAS